MLKKYQHELRSQQTEAENHLWHFLRDRRLHGWKFRRQCILQSYIVDFVCFEKKLVVEIDGLSHETQKEYDESRTRNLESDGFIVMRFRNDQVIGDVGGVLDIICKRLKAPLIRRYAPPSPTRGEG